MTASRRPVKTSSLILKTSFVTVALACVLLGLSPFCAGQQRVSFSSPEDAARTLAKCDRGLCAQATRLLQLTFPLARGCDITAVSAPLEPKTNDAVLKIDCTGDFGVVLLREGPEGRWLYVNSLSYPQGDVYGRLEMKVLNIFSPDTKDIVIEHLIGDHGTGYLEEYFVILRVVEGQLGTVADVMQRFVRAGWPGVLDVDERSTFTFDAPTTKQPGDVVERLTISASTLPKIVLRRGLHWDPESRIYAPDGWDTVNIFQRPR